MHAVINRGKKVVQSLVENGADINLHDNCGDKKTALMYAGEKNRVGCLEALLDAENIDINFKNPMGITGLSWASMCGSTDAVTMFLERDANPNL